jgi:hypothetical protein
MKKIIAAVALACVMSVGAFAVSFGLDIDGPVTGGTPWIDLNLGFEKCDVIAGVLAPLKFHSNASYDLGFRGGVSVNAAKIGKVTLSIPLLAEVGIGIPDEGDTTYALGIDIGAKVKYEFTKHLGVFAMMTAQVIGLDNTGGNGSSGSKGDTTFGILDATSTSVGVLFNF